MWVPCASSLIRMVPVGKSWMTSCGSGRTASGSNTTMSATMPGCNKPRSCNQNTDARLKGQSPHSRFKRHDLLLAHPLAQEPGAEPKSTLELNMCTTIRQADDRVRVIQYLRHRLIIDV